MNRLWSHISKWVLVVIPVLLATASAEAQLAVSQGQMVELSVKAEPGVSYSWDLYSDSTANFAVDPGDVTADVASFINGINQGPRVQVAWNVPGIYFYKVTAVDALGCTNNIKVGRISIVEVSAELIPPIAINDEYDVDCDEQFLDIGINDTIPDGHGGVFSILDWPMQGTLQGVDHSTGRILDEDGLISYTIDFFAVGRDSFKYTLCLDIDRTICDTATVYINIPDGLDCTPAPPTVEPDTSCHFFIPEGFSPNGDGIHDYFVVDCIDHYPDARMMIYDKQGYLLYQKANYGNTDVWGFNNADLWWGGQTIKNHHNSGQTVVPGVYLYILDLGNGNLKRGFVMVAYGKGN